MSVYKPKKSKTFQFDYRWQGHRYHGSTGCTSRRDAERYEANHKRKVALGDETKEALTVEAASDLWFESVGKYLASHATCLYQLGYLASILGPSTLLHDIRVRELDDYVAQRRALVSNASVSREIALLRRVVNWCGERDFEVPAIAWKALRLKEAAVKTRVLSRDEQERLFAALPDSLKPIVEFALLSGKRKAEIVSLLWSDVDFVEMRAKVRVKGGEVQSFPLTPRLRTLIANQPKVCPQVFTYVAERDSPPRKDRVRRIKGQRYPFSVQGWDRKWRKALEDARIEGYRFHDNRHTALTRTGAIEIAYLLAGHSDIRTTKRYFHTSEAEVRRAMIAGESRAIPEPVDESAENDRKINEAG
jgi:integrase